MVETRGHTLKKSFQKPSLVNSSWDGFGLLGPLPTPSIRKCWLPWFGENHMQATTTTMNSSIHDPIKSRRHCFHFPNFWSCNLSSPSSKMVPELWEDVCGVNVPSVTEKSTVNYSLHFNMLWFSLLATIHCTNKLLWWILRAILIYRYRDKN